MVVNEFKLERLNSSNVSQKGIKFLTATGFSDNITVSNVSFNYAGASSDNNFSENWGGFKRLISVTAILHNDGTDKSTDGSGKITLIQQKQYLMNSGGIIQGTASGDTQNQNRYRVTLYMDGVSETIKGTIEDFTINGDVTTSNILTCTFNLFEAQ